MTVDYRESLSEESFELFKGLRKMHDELDKATLGHFSRINPTMENVVDWREKGRRFLSEGSVVFDSATLMGDIKAGENCWVGLNCLLDGSGGLTIGSYCVFASGVHVYTHDTVKWALSGGKQPYKHSPVVIGDCVFVGAQSVITAGSKIGNNVLVCANATVVGEIPDYAIVAGTPGRIIGRVEISGDDVDLRYFKKEESEEDRAKKH